MRFYSATAMEKAMTIQEVILRVYAKKLNWIQFCHGGGSLKELLRGLVVIVE